MVVATRETFSQAAPAVETRRRIRDRVRELGLERNVDELESQGYTIVEDAAPIEVFDGIREGVLAVTDEVHARGGEPFNFGPNTSMVYRLLARRDVFVEAILSPKVVAVIAELLGEGYTSAATTGSVLHQGSKAGPLHADNQFFPEPFSDQAQIATAIWCCEDFDEASGSTHVVPGSNRLRRHPRPGEGLDEAVAIEAPKGSVVIWTGQTWHCNGARANPGARVALHTSFARPHIQPFEGYTAEEVEHLVAVDERMVRIVGADLPYHFMGDGPEAAKLLALAVTTQAAD